MESIRWITIMLSVFLCQATSSLKKPELKRVKRWEGTGDMSNMFRGTAGVDYPDYKTIPTTTFRCSEHEYEGGLYADVETQCQVFHVCHDGRKDSFLCGRGTIFNQQILACDYWYSTECDTAPSFYYLNSQIGNPGSSWVPQGGDSQHNTQTNSQASNYAQTYPQTRNQEANYGQNNSQSSGEGIPYNQNNPQRAYQGSNDPGSYNPGTSKHGIISQYNPGPNNQEANYQEYNLNLENRKNDGNSGADQDEKSCCCLKNTYKAPWNFPAFTGSQSKK